MSRVRKLRIETLETDFDKLEKDYRDVDDKKRRESNPQDKNNLDLQLKTIIQQMEEIERELDQLKQPEAITDNTKTLLDLLSPCEKEILSCLQKAYYACSPEDWHNSAPDTLAGILAELKTIQQGCSTHTPIERWVGYLSTNPQLPLSVYHPLNQWAEQNIQGFSELLQEIGNSPISTNAYLMVVVKASNQSSVSDPNNEDQYFVDAWFSKNNQDLDWVKLSSADSFPETVAADQIREILKACVDEISTKYFPWENLTVELFLPLVLLNEGIDKWTVDEDDEFGFPVPIGCHYQVFVRSSERLLPTYNRYRGCWQEKWKCLQQLGQQSVCNAFVSGDSDDLRVLFVKLTPTNIIGVKLINAPKQVGKGSVFAVIIKAGIPVALWLRESLSLNCQEQMDRLLGGCIHKLPEAVKTSRLEAFSHPQDLLIGNHLSLLWEDPYHLPPTIDYSM
jgi:hypothetical protein